MAGRASKRQATVRNAANSGDRRRLLVSLRNLIADQLDSGKVSPRDLAALTKRIVDITEQIEAIDMAEAEKENPVATALNVADEPLGDRIGADDHP
ncbi:hypothetical protein DSM100688_0400 [Bifidobacterium ramosum]|uniref:Terminase small subunit n=1 Tax=Bifidobacterium ramosum TaxID=1798158 RepID=A0A6L4X311_9BIFI|nr:hypothetical protein [Bifidobacterium ramosum]KAB8289320.1 hypothetical protein DSM100688_0400 [Bifidobacterium ramosum]NEG71023.1 hypothetical protein [Bifidobacterium ramosum]